MGCGASSIDVSQSIEATTGGKSPSADPNARLGVERTRLMEPPVRRPVTDEERTVLDKSPEKWAAPLVFHQHADDVFDHYLGKYNVSLLHLYLNHLLYG